MSYIIPGSQGTGQGTSDHHALQNLTTYDDHTQYIPVDGSRPLENNWDAGPNTIQAKNFVSDVESGVVPIVVSSVTPCPNLNADMLDGLHGAEYIKADGSVAMDENLIMGGNSITGISSIVGFGDILIRKYESNVETGIAPFTATSTTVCPNLNADMVDGAHGAALIHTDGSIPMAANLNMGGHSITNVDNIDYSTATFSGPVTATNFISNVATGTAPVSTTSTTVCSNLNADMVDGTHGSALIHADGSVAMVGDLDMGENTINNLSVIDSAVLDVTGMLAAASFMTESPVDVPFEAANTLLCPNLNADMVDGTHGSALIHADGSVAMTGYLNMDQHAIVNADSVSSVGPISSGDLITAATFKSIGSIGAPITTQSTAICTNLNADMVDGTHGSALIHADGSVAMTGYLNMDQHAIVNADSVSSVGPISSGNLITAATFKSIGSIGAPIITQSTAICTNLNADMLDGLHGVGYIKADGTQPLTGDWAAAKNISTVGGVSGATITATGLSKGATFQSTQVTGTAPISVASTTACPNLNADMLDGLHGTGFLKADGTVTLTGNLAVAPGITIDGVDVSTIAASSHPPVSLNAQSSTVLTLIEQTLGLQIQPSGTALMAPMNGSSTAYPTFRPIVGSDIQTAEGVLTLANGINNDVLIVAYTDLYTISGPTADFGITGIVGGYPGRHITIANIGINKNLSFYHLDINSLPSNRIICPGNLSTVTTNGYGSVNLVYLGTSQKWLITSIIT